MIYAPEGLGKILRAHERWLRGEEDGTRVDLSHAKLYSAYLYRSNLREADLCYADLRRTNLCKADLYRANLHGSDLRGANLRGANLSGSDLRGADLQGADLRGADLSCIEVNELTSGYFMTCPEKGAYVGFKKCQEDRIVELLIPEDALRSSATTRKCRASKAKVLSITSVDGSVIFKDAASKRDRDFIYRVGEMIEVPDFDQNRWKECSEGIHHFISREEAVAYR